MKTVLGILTHNLLKPLSAPPSLINFQVFQHFSILSGIEQVAIDGGFHDPSTGRPFDFLASFGYFNGTTMHLGPNCPEDYNLYAGRRT
jgi:hypothetical protein